MLEFKYILSVVFILALIIYYRIRKRQWEEEHSDGDDD